LTGPPSAAAASAFVSSAQALRTLVEADAGGVVAEEAPAGRLAFALSSASFAASRTSEAPRSTWLAAGQPLSDIQWLVSYS